MALAWVVMTFLLVSSQMHAATSPGVIVKPPEGFQVSNIDPNIDSPYSNQIYDPNFIPGFAAGLPNVSVDWRSGAGYARIGYQVGPLSHLNGGVPHLAVGPQCCNFAEIPRTQQFRLPGWGDYYYVRSGFSSPGVNVENFTTDFSAPAYVGLRTDWNWTVQFSIDWSEPSLLDKSNEWASIGLVATQYVPSVPGKLVYTEVNFWMDGNSSAALVPSGDGIARAVSSPNLVTYHPLQLVTVGNQTVSVGLSGYLRDTLRALGLDAQSEQPVISYVYLSVEGYNFRWNGTLWSFFVLAPSVGQGGWFSWEVAGPALAVLAAAVVVLASWAVLRRRGMGPPPASP